MNERRKILDMLAAGKLTPEQAEMLLEALGLEPGQSKGTYRGFPKMSMPDLKTFGAQFSTAVSQTLSDVKRVIDHQKKAVETHFENLSLLSSTMSIHEELTLADDVRHLTVETANGKVQVIGWDQPVFQVFVRGMVKTDSMEVGQRLLHQALRSEATGDHHSIAVVQGVRDPETGATLQGAHIDLMIPAVATLRVRTENGAVHVDSARLNDLFIETKNGGITLYQTHAVRMRIVSENGALNLRHAIDEQTSSVYAQTQNGTLLVDGISMIKAMHGSAASHVGQIEIDPAQFDVQYSQPRRTNAHFHRTGMGEQEGPQVQLETRNGVIRIRA